ncbi:hypothetical protein GLOTRDRAFT_95658 [Gloeophyllum trabeum ATCC 11539]|uniref:Uncharacterized protein n=1 Tax=Gloeophyllum trabeum (strain ATCC 11539 / FP-39264 / Madison 617) TaxID=670483 RepID=S7RJM6_GLOTA|nr:uncharacterized protein GLOTRDRAFT_95658 [Gloeophyllum trabeum ATCC 11539]EPQ52839.1 hypothetical protein GLOTRDRAFT_95658 [Gloeophyllum trabeum ATCC 11539]
MTEQGASETVAISGMRPAGGNAEEAGADPKVNPERPAYPRHFLIIHHTEHRKLGRNMLFGPSRAWLVGLLWISLAASVFAAPQAVSSPGNSSVTPTGAPTTSASTPANSPSTVLSPNPSIESSPSSASPSTPARATSTSPAAPPVQASHTSEAQSSSEEPSRPTTTSSASTHSDPAPPASAPAQGGQGSSSTPDRNTAPSSPTSPPTTSHNDSASPSSEHGASPSTSPPRAPQGGSGQTSTSLSPAPPDTSTRTTSPTSVTRAPPGGSGDSTTTTRSPSSDPPGTSTGRAGQDTTTQGGSGPGTTSTTNQPPSTSPSRAPGQGGTSTRSSSDGGATSETSRGSTTSHTSPGHPGQGGTSTTSHSSVSTSATGRDQSTTTSRTSSDDPGQGRTSSSTSHSSASTSGSSDGSSATTTYTSPGHPGQGGTSTTSHSGGLTSTITSSASHSSPSHPGQGESSGSASSTSDGSGSTTSTEPHSHTSVSNPGQGATSRSSSGSGSGEPTSRSRSTDGASSTTSGNRTTTPTADPSSSPSGSDSSRSPSATESHRGSSVSPTTDNVTASGSSGSGNPSSSRSSRQPSETGGSSPSHAVSGSETAGSSRRPGPSGSGSPQQTRSTNPSETATGAGPHFTSLSDGRPDGLSSSPRSGAQRTISGTPTPTVRTSRPSDTSSPGALAYSTSLTDDSTSRRGGDGRTSIVSVTLVYTSTSPGGLVTTITTVVPTQTLIPNSLTGTKSLKHDPGAIAGIVIGSLAAILVLVLWIKFAMRTRRVQRLESDALASLRDESPGPLDNEIDSHPAPGGAMGERAVLPLAAAGGYGSVSRFRSRDGTLYASVDEDEPYSAGALSGHSPAAFGPFADPFDGSDEAGISSSPRVMTEHIPGGPPPSAWLRGSFAPSGGVSRFPSGAVAEDPLILTGGASDPEVDEQFLSGLARVGAYASGSGSSEGHALAPSSMGHSPASALYSPDGALSRNRLSVPETRRQSSLGHGSSSESHSGEDNRAGRAVVGGLEGSARPTPSRTSSVRGLLSRGLNWRQPRPQSAVTVPTFFEPPPELVSRPGPRSSLPPTSPMVPMRPHTMSDSGHGSLVRANRPGFVPHWHDQGTFGPRMVTLESSSALPSPAATDATTGDGLLRLEGEAARSTADISLLDEVDYSRPIGGLVHNRTHSMTTFETQDTRRTVRTGQSNPETPLSVLQDPFRDLLDDGLGSEAGHTIGH